MRYTTLGRSGLHVTSACLGTMNVGTDAQAPTGPLSHVAAAAGLWRDRCDSDTLLR